MAQLPRNLTLPQMQVQWAGALNPVLANPIINGLQINDIILINGTNIFNHKLARNMQGWFITDIQGVASIYRPETSPFNSKTLTLISSAAVIANLWVY